MQVFDPHIDIADMSQLIGFSSDEFYAESSSTPVSLAKLKQADIKVVGLSLYYDQSLVTTSFYDGVKDYLATRLTNDQLKQICYENWQRVFVEALT